MEILTKYENVLIYGAKAIAWGVFAALREVYHINIKSFLVSERKGNQKEIQNIPVHVLEETKYENEKSVVLIAVSESLHEEVLSKLSNYGYTNTVCIDSHTEYLLMSEYYRKIRRFPLLEDEMDSNKFSTVRQSDNKFQEDFKVYMVKSHFDRPLKNSYDIPRWVIPIQAGTELTNKRLCEVTDNVGCSISEKNQNYCELTATYWVWKNVHTEFKGIFHYRRMLNVSDMAVQGLLQGQYDAILPLPYLCFPNTEEQWRRFVPPDAWDAVETAIRELTPDYYEPFQQIIQGQYIYNYNMLIAREDIFDQYCTWLFPILNRAEELTNPKECVRTDRAMAYAGEVLSALYFMYHEKNLKIVHSEKIWMV